MLSLDLTDFEGVCSEVKRIHEKMGHIGGVIHAAGIYDAENPAFIRKKQDGLRKVLSPKVDGLNTLLKAFENQPLKFFILFSSVSAVVPALASGQSDYAMANAYMDYVAEAKFSELPIVSIQWNSWKETGMGEAKTPAFKQTGFLSQTNEEGLHFLDDILSGQLGPVVLPAVVDSRTWSPEALMKAKSEIKTTKTIKKLDTKYKLYEEQVTEDIRNNVQKWITDLFAMELKLSEKELERMLHSKTMVWIQSYWLRL